MPPQHTSRAPHRERSRPARGSRQDAGLAHLGRLTGLAGLNVTGTKVTDAGLIHLKQLPKLTKLNVTAIKKFLSFWATVTR